ncbi:MAG: hypothetical protein ABIP50_02750 [Candidatus Saccharimonadales bacterium]
MEFTKVDRLFTPLRPEIAAKIQAISEKLTDIYDDDQAKTLLVELNHELTKHKLVGDTVQVSSADMVWGSYGLDGNFIPVLDVALLEKHIIAGTFLGVGELDIDGLRTVVYNLQVEIDDEATSSFVISAPIETSHLAVEVEIPASVQTDNELAQHFQVLAEIEDPAFRELIKAFMDVLDDNDMLNASMLRHLGVLVTEMLAHSEVQDNDRRQDAISNILAEILNDDGIYTIVGQEFMIDRQSPKGTLFLKSFEATGGVAGVSLVNDYTTNELSIDTFKSTFQPAAIFQDGSNRRYTIPLKYITTFDMLEGPDMSPDPDGCRASIGRFLMQNPQVLKAMKW